MGNKRVHQVGEGDHTCLEITDGGEVPGNVKRAEDKPLYLGGKRNGNQHRALSTWRKKLEGWLEEGNYSMTKGIHSKAEKSEGTLHPLQKNKKVQAAELTEEKHTERLVAGATK